MIYLLASLIMCALLFFYSRLIGFGSQHIEDADAHFASQELDEIEDNYDCPIHGMQDGPDCPRC